MVTDLPGCDPGVVIDVIAYPCVSAAGGAVEVARVVVVVLAVVAIGLGVAGVQPARVTTVSTAAAMRLGAGVIDSMTQI
jgi:hypothetical protein